MSLNAWQFLAAAPIVVTGKALRYAKTWVDEAETTINTSGEVVTDTVDGAGDIADIAKDVVEEGQDLVEDAIGVHRYVWQGDNGHALIEARGIDDPDNEGMRKDLQTELNNVDSVKWVKVNALTRRVIVAFESGSSLEKLVSTVEAVENAHGIRERSSAPEWESEIPASHPSEEEPIHRAIAALAGNSIALGLSIVGQLTGKVLLMDRMASLLTLIDITPKTRSFVEEQIGKPAKQLLFPLLSAVGNGLGQGTAGIIADSAYHTSLLTEGQARNDVWKRREPELYSKDGKEVIEPPVVGPRPCPIPDGPVETWIQNSSYYTTILAGSSLLYTWSLSTSADILFSGVAKAAHFGREGFAAQMGRVLSAKGVIPLDASALRRLDRVNTVVLDSNTLLKDRLIVDEVIPVNGRSFDEANDAARQALSFQSRKDHYPESFTSDGDEAYKLVACDAESDQTPEYLKPSVRQIEEDGLQPYLLLEKENTVAVVGIAEEIDPLTDALISAIREGGMKFILAGTNGNLHKRLDHDGQIPAGREMGAAVRQMQAEGAVVTVMARSGTNGLVAADVAINIAKPSGRPSWGGDLLCGPDLEEAVFIIKACKVAKDVSRRSVQIAATGTGMGILSALMANQNKTPSYSSTMVNSAALSALAYGTYTGIELDRSPKAVAFDTTPWHELDIEQVLEKLESKPDGLTTDQARFQLRTTNAEDPAPHYLEPFIAELANPLNPVLAVGSALSLLTGSRVDAAMVASFIGINTLIGGFQQLYTERSLKEIWAKTSGSALVIRDGNVVELPVDQIVPGDIVQLSTNQTVPADCRIIEATNLEVDESNISGEALPVQKDPEPSWNDSITERRNMLYEDSTIVAGEATAVVVATGLQTHISRTMVEAGSGSEVTGSGVELRLRELTAQVMPVAAIGGITSLAGGLLNRWTGHDLLSTGVSIAIASVPEGLPFIATAAQLSSMKRLAAKNAVVRNPKKIEALGRVDVLCFDKTGTLTEGSVKLKRIGDAQSHRTLDEMTSRDAEVLAHAYRATAINGETEDHDAINGNEHVEFNLTDQSITEVATELGIDKQHELDSWDVVGEVPFEATRGMHAVVADTNNGRMMSVKGAPEKVLEKCTTIATLEGSRKLTQKARDEALSTMETLMEQGNRVLGVARKKLKKNEAWEDEDPHQLEFLGVLGFSDPVRDTAIEAVENVRKAGVKVVMITGDHPGTAENIAQQLNMFKPMGPANGSEDSENRILTGLELSRMSDEELDAIVQDVAVYARVTPRQKVRVVKSLQRLGRTVAMTGDGANDAPAIRLADVGVAMGVRGTTAAREASDMIVTDDRLETIVESLIEGRALWGSVREAIGVVVGGNLGEISFPALTSLVSSKPPMNARQFLLVNLFTDLLPALAIAVRPPTAKTPEMLQIEGPEASLGTALSDKITQRAIFTTAGATSAWTLGRLTGTQESAGTVGLIGLVGSQLGQTLAEGGVRNPLVLASVGGSIIGLFTIVQTPGVSQFFGCRPVGPIGWSIGVTSSIMATGGSVIASKFLDSRQNLLPKKLVSSSTSHEEEVTQSLPDNVHPLSARTTDN